MGQGRSQYLEQTNRHDDGGAGFAIGADHAGFGGMGGVIVGVDSITAVKGDAAIAMTRLRIVATEDSPHGLYKSGCFFDSYVIR